MDLCALVILTLVALLYRWSITFFPYSGHSKPPMYGDYEAQRHWMEITYGLPVGEWYTNTSRNDLDYWGLDYPPLTAYHSYIMGYISSKINASWVAVRSSRGVESCSHKLFMRFSALTSEILFLPFVIVYFQVTQSTESRLCYAPAALLHPGLVLIDHGHFQYNMVSLGMTLLAVVFLYEHCDLLGSVAFCLAINYKHLELYHAVPFFCYLLGRSLKLSPMKCLMKLLSLGSVVLATFGACWYPFLWEWQQVLQVLHRLFPFDRGLFEDKVSNFWCSLSSFVKVKLIFDVSSLARLSLFATAVCVSPVAYDLLLRPTLKRFILSLFNSGLAFYLFAFQVHEKSILLATLPAVLLLPEYPLACSWFLQTATFSMFPLLLKDHLTVPFSCGQLIFLVITLDINHLKSVGPVYHLDKWIRNIMFPLSTIGMVVVCLAHCHLQPPARYPDLFPVINSLYCFFHFIIFFGYFLRVQLTMAEGVAMPANHDEHGRVHMPKD